jgi:regulatory protein
VDETPVSTGAKPADAAHAAAMSLLARRPLGEAELRRRLETAGHDPQACDAACRRLRDDGYLNDARLAEEYIVARSARLGHGPERLISELVRRGLDEDVVAAAWQRLVERGDLDPRELLRAELRRRLAPYGSKLDRRAYARVYNTLLRSGFPADDVSEALRPHRPNTPPGGRSAEWDVPR